jgi:hypothetical protein
VYPSLFGKKTVGELTDHLEMALGRAGYSQFRYFRCEDRIILVTPIERIDSRGYPNPKDRWISDSWWLFPKLLEWLDLYKSNEVGRCRVFVFLLERSEGSDDRRIADYDRAKKWVGGGQSYIDNSSRSESLTNSHRLRALVYEWILIKGEIPKPVMESETKALEQLRNTGIQP